MRKSRKKSNTLYLIVIGLVFLWPFFSEFINFIKENTLSFYLILILFFALLALLYVPKIISNYRQEKERVENYRTTPFYQASKLPYDQLPTNRGQVFEIEVYNRLKNEFGNSVSLLMNCLIPKYNSTNEYTEIDMIVFHSSGIYVLEIKNLSGPLVGNNNQDYWQPYIKSNNNLSKESYQRNFAIKGFDRSGLFNPIKQNQFHIKSLNALVPASYINKVIFSNSMLIDKSNHPQIHSLSEFVSLIKLSSQIKYSFNDLTNVFERIKKIIVVDRKAYELHKARLKKSS